MIERSKAMVVLSRGSQMALGVLALFLAGSAGAQENLDQGKTPAQLFAANCVVCHKKPQGLARPGVSGLDIFLRQHYTASRESAAAIAIYLQSVGSGPAGSDRATKHKGEERTKTGEKKPKIGKPGEAKSGEAKSGAAKPADAKPPDAKSAEPKSSEPKPSEPKPSESKASEPKSSEPESSEPKSSESKSSEPGEAKPSEPKPSEPKPVPKSEKSD
jgi:hypothetical protein